MSFVYLFLGISIVCLIGLPASMLLCFPTKKLHAQISTIKLWALSPFMGYALIVAVLKLFLLTSLSVQYTAWISMALFAVMYFFFFKFLKKHNIFVLSLAPAKFFLVVSAGILCLVSISYFIMDVHEYKMYSSTDLIYYQSNAESLRIAPLNELTNASSNNHLFTTGTMFFSGRHRISLGLFQAFLSTLLFTDTASIIGVTGAFCVFSIFCAILYVAKTIEIKTNPYLVAFFCAMAPVVVSSTLEGFLPMVLFSAFQIIAVILLFKTFEHLDIQTTTLTAIFISAAFTTLLEGVFTITGIAFILLVAMLLSKKTTRFSLVHGGILALSIVILNFPILKYILLELFDEQYKTREFLNGLFPYSYSKMLATKMIWGFSTTGSNLPNILNLAASIFALLISCVGIYGIINLYVKRHKEIGLGFSAIALMPIVFFAKEGDSSYAIYKATTLAFPVIMLGVFVFWDEIKELIDAHWRFSSEETKNIKLKKAVKLVGTWALSLLFAISSSISVYRCYSVSTIELMSADTPAWGLLSYSSPQANKIYKSLRAENNKNLLFLPTQDLCANGWMVFYSYMNNLYFLSQDQEIPNDILIYRNENNIIEIADETHQKDYAAVISYDIANNPQAPQFKPADKYNSASGFEFILTSFAKKEANITLKISVKDFKGTESLVYHAITYECDAQGLIQIPLVLQKGTSEFKISNPSSESITISSFELLF